MFEFKRDSQLQEYSIQEIRFANNAIYYGT